MNICVAFNVTIKILKIDILKGLIEDLNTSESRGALFLELKTISNRARESFKKGEPL